mgnify:CR=1 FL=1
MKKIIFALFISAGIAQAQNRPSEHWKESKLEVLAEELSLSSTQKEDLKKLRIKYTDQNQNLRKKHKEEKCKIRREKLEDMKNILTKGQMKQIREKRSINPIMRMKNKHPKMYEKTVEARTQFNSKLTHQEKKQIQKARKMAMELRTNAFPCGPDKQAMFEVNNLLEPIIKNHKEDLKMMRKDLHTEKSDHKGHHHSKQRVHGEKQHKDGHHREHQRGKLLYLFLLMNA